MKPSFIYFNMNEWAYESDMTDTEKEKNPSYKAAGGFLRTYTYKEAWKKAFDSASKKDLELLKALPNFDADVFFEISGVRV